MARETGKKNLKRKFNIKKKTKLNIKGRKALFNNEIFKTFT